MANAVAERTRAKQQQPQCTHKGAKGVPFDALFVEWESAGPFNNAGRPHRAVQYATPWALRE